MTESGRRYVLAIDGGGTKTVALVADDTGRTIGHGRVEGPGNERLIALNGQRRVLIEAIRLATAELGDSPPEFSAAKIFMPASGTELRELLDAPGLRDRFAPIRAIDACAGIEGSMAATGAFAGPYADRNVVTIVAGTGSLGWGHARDGRTLTAGGWGERLGDDGSAHSIAQRAVRIALQAADGLIEPTLLTRKLLDFFGAPSVKEFGNKVYQSPGIPREAIAAFCPEVFAAAGHGDAAARTILREEAAYLARLAHALMRNLRITGEEVHLVPTGSVWNGGGAFTESFRETLARLAPTAAIVKPRLAPVAGGALQALQALHGTLEQPVIDRLVETLPEHLAHD